MKERLIKRYVLGLSLYSLHLGMEYEVIDSASEFDVICTATDIINSHRDGDDVYLAKLMTKSGTSINVKDGRVTEDYEAVLCWRHFIGWHKNDSDHYEDAFVVTRHINGNEEYWS